MACNAQCFTAPRLQAQHKQCKQGRIQLTHVSQPAHSAPAGRQWQSGQSCAVSAAKQAPCCLVYHTAGTAACMQWRSGRAHAALAQRDDGDLGRVDERRRVQPADRADVGHGQRAARQVVAGQPPRRRRGLQSAQLRGDAGQAALLGALHVGHLRAGGRVAAARCAGRACRGPPAHWLLAGGRHARSLSGALPAGAGALAASALPALLPYAPPTPGASLPSRTTRGQLRTL